ncbi:unnamed protein product, partial [Amoebophrya sp. A25]|eukprot:GSA25T00027542001.1
MIAELGVDAHAMPSFEIDYRALVVHNLAPEPMRWDQEGDGEIVWHDDEYMAMPLALALYLAHLSRTFFWCLGTEAGERDRKGERLRVGSAILLPKGMKCNA